MDRIVEKFLRAGPESRGLTFTANFPLHPFVCGGKEIRYSDSPQWVYTTIGDMTKPAEALGYTYGPTTSRDATEPYVAVPSAVLCTHFSTARKPNTAPFVLFSPVNCIPKSYQIDMYAESDCKMHYIGRETRIGMGPGQRGDSPKNMDRCIKRGITRILDASAVADELGTGNIRLVQMVVEIETGRQVPEEEWSRWVGFRGTLVWGNGKWGM